MTRSAHPRVWRSVMSPSTRSQQDGRPETEWRHQSPDTYVISHEAFSRASECLNGKRFAFLHLRLIPSFNDRYALTSVNRVLVNVMAVEVTDAFNRQRLTTNLHFVAFHYLLDRRADIAHSDINTGFLSRRQRHASLCRNTFLNTLTPVFVASLTAARRLS